MAGGKSRSYIILEVLAVILLGVLWYILTEPPKIWKTETGKEQKCQQNLKALYEAQKYYFQKTQSYNFDFNSVLSYLNIDSSLQNKKVVVKYSRNLSNHIARVLAIPAVNSLYRIHSAATDIVTDFDANVHYLKRDSSYLQTADNIKMELRSLYNSTKYNDLADVFLYIDSLSMLKFNLNDYKIQIASRKALIYTDSIQVKFASVHAEMLNEVITPKLTALYEFWEVLRRSELAKFTNIPDRIKKFNDQIKRANDDFSLLVMSEQNKALQNQHAQLKKLHEDYLSPEKYNSTSRFALLALEETDSILVSIDESFAVCPDMDHEPYMFRKTGANGILIECPTLQKHSKEVLMGEMDKIKSFPIWSSAQTIITANDSLKVIAEQNKNLLRKNRDYFMQYKDIESDLEGFEQSNILSFKYVSNISEMLDTLSKDFRLSYTEQLFTENLNGFDTIAARCEKKNFIYLDRWMQLVERKVLKYDSLAYTYKLNRRQKGQLIDIKPVLEYWKAEFENFKSQFNPSYSSQLKEVRVNLKDKFDELKNGVGERQKVIFKEVHKNHGFVDNGNLSWEMKE